MAGAAALLLTTAPPASAEGWWDSGITGALTGFDSRWWNKKKDYDAATKIRFNDCWASGPDRSTTVQLTRKKWGPLPDENRGQKTFTACFKGGARSTGDWGKQRGDDDDYRFTIVKINGSKSGYSLNVDYLEVEY